MSWIVDFQAKHHVTVQEDAAILITVPTHGRLAKPLAIPKVIQQTANISRSKASRSQQIEKV